MMIFTGFYDLSNALDGVASRRDNKGPKKKKGKMEMGNENANKEP